MDVELNPALVDVFDFRSFGYVNNGRFEANRTLDTGETVVMVIEYRLDVLHMSREYYTGSLWQVQLLILSIHS